MADTVREIEIAEAMKGEQPEVIERPRKPLPWGKFFVYFVLLLGAAIALLPFLWMLSTSAMTLGEVAVGRIIPTGILEGDVGGVSSQFTQNYTEAWSRANFAQYMWNSFRITGISILGTLAFCIPAAYAFARMEFFGKNILFGLMLSTMMIPEIVNIAPNLLTVVWLGRLGTSICGEACAWMDNWPSLTVPFWATAFTIFLLRQFFAQIPQDLWDAARIDGAGHFTFMWRVVMPLSKAPSMTVVVFSFVGSWNALIWPLMVVQTDEWRPVAVGLTKFITQDEPGQFHLQMAASVMMTIPILIVYFFAQRQFTEGFTFSGLKG